MLVGDADEFVAETEFAGEYGPILSPTCRKRVRHMPHVLAGERKDTLGNGAKEVFFLLCSTARR